MKIGVGVLEWIFFSGFFLLLKLDEVGFCWFLVLLVSCLLLFLVVVVDDGFCWLLF